MALTQRRRWLALIIGWHIFIFAGASFFWPTVEAPTAAPATAKPAAASMHMCPMMCVDPQPEPGRCAVCGMDLVPMPAGGAGGGANELVMSEAALKLARVALTTARRGRAELALRLEGKVAVAETREKVLSAWVPGRLEKVYVDNTGTRVGRGERLVNIYSQKLNAEKAIYAATLREAGFVKAKAGRSRKDLIRTRLRNIGLLDRQIDEIDQKHKAGQPLGYTQDLLSPLAGTVLHKNVREGMYVAEGEPLYTIADLSEVWVVLEAYESDLAKIRYGQPAQIAAPAYPGKIFRGRVSFVSPQVDDQKRTAQVRIAVANQERLLKPNMLVSATVTVALDANSAVIAPAAYAGKWVCPAQPERLFAQAGVCPDDGKTLLSASELGYAPSDPGALPLLLKASAVLYGGRESVVYQQVKDKAKTVFRGMPVKLGARAGDDYIILAGLQEGATVAARGAFMLDSAMQLSGKNSLMNAPAASEPAAAASVEPAAAPVTLAPAAAALLQKFLADYFALQEALAYDKVAAYPALAKQLAVAATNLSRQTFFADSGAMFNFQATAMAAAADIEKARAVFQPLSVALDALLRRVRPLNQAVYQVFCPMAFNNQGAFWLSAKKTVLNPYEGKRMRACGVVQETLWEEGE